MEALPGRGIVVDDALTVARLVWPSFVKVEGVLLLDFIAGSEVVSMNLNKVLDKGADERAAQESFNFVETAHYFAKENPLQDTSIAERQVAELLGESWKARLTSLGLEADYEVVVSEWFEPNEWTVHVLRRAAAAPTS